MTKSIFTIILSLLTSFSLQAQEVITQELKGIDAFDSIEASLGWQVTFEQGDKYTVRISYPAEDQDLIQVESKNGCLVLGQQKDMKNKRHSNRVCKDKYYATVTAPELRSLEVNTGACVTVQNRYNSTRNLEVDVSTAGELIVDALQLPFLDCDISTAASVLLNVSVQKIRVDCSTGGSVTINGSADSAILENSTGGSITAKKLTTRQTSADSTLGGEITVTATESFTGDTSLGGRIIVYGSPRSVTKDRGVIIK